MKARDIQTRKLHLIEDISRLDDPQIIAKVEELLRYNRKATYEAQLKPMTTAELQSRIDASEAAINEGRVISQEDLEKEAENW